jgi:Acyl-CoA carboxylase epsilon subunit
VTGSLGEAPPAPTLAVLRGRPEPEELAALLVVVSALSAEQPPDAGAADGVHGWHAYWRQIGAVPPTGPGAWAAARRW